MAPVKSTARLPRVYPPAGTPSFRARQGVARLRGERTFDPGVPCGAGHVSPRNTSSGHCRECDRVRGRAVYAANPKANIDRAVAWRLANPAREKALDRSWYERNKPRLLEKAADRYSAKREELKENMRDYAQQNGHVIRANNALRRARKCGAETGDRKAYRAYVKWARSAPRVPCYWCRAMTIPGHRDIDHIIPISKGGADAVANLCIACPTCNASKHAKLPEEFAGQSELRLT